MNSTLALLIFLRMYSNFANQRLVGQDAIRRNRLLFSNLRECRFSWSAAGQSGSFTADAAPRETTTAAIKVPAAEKVHVAVTDPRGIVIDEYDFTAVPALTVAAPVKTVPAGKTETATEIRITGGSLSMIIDKATSSLTELQFNGKTILAGDALLMLLPLNGQGNGTQMKGDNARFDAFTATCANRAVTRMELVKEGDDFILMAFDQSDDARGFTGYRITDGSLVVTYSYEVLRTINPRQTGLVFTLPGGFQELSWERTGQWNYYPDDQIGRLKGTTPARNACLMSGPAGPAARPSLGWMHDQNEWGTNDFRSTKMNISKASLSDGTSRVTVSSDGSQSIRCWLDGGVTRMLVAGYSNMGAEGFFRGHAAQVDRPLKAGDIVEGTIRLHFAGGIGK